MTINILILAAGGKASEASEGNHYPLCLTEIKGRSLLEIIVDKTKALHDSRYIVALNESDCRKFYLDNVARLLMPDPHIAKVPENAAGAACSALLSLCSFDDEDSVLVISANELVDIDLQEVISKFVHSGYDAGTITFESIHPRYSYVRINPDTDLIIEAAQNVPLSKQATVGIFWFNRLKDFIHGAQNMVRKDASVDGRFFIAPIFNQLILEHKKIGYVHIDAKFYMPLKNRDQISRMGAQS